MSAKKEAELSEEVGIKLRKAFSGNNKKRTQQEHNNELDSLLGNQNISTSTNSIGASATNNLVNKTVRDQDALAAEQMRYTKDEEREIKLEEKLDTAKIELTEEQKKEIIDARNQTHSSNPLQGAVPIPNSDFGDEVTDAQNDKIKQEQELAEETEEINQAIQEKVASLEEERDAKVESAREGPRGVLAFFASNTVFLIMAVVDSIVSGSIPIVGDSIMAIVLFAFWSIPALLTFDLMLWVRIAAFIAIDWAVGTFGGTIANFIPFAGDMAVDFLPEAYVLFTHRTIPDLLRKTYFDKLPSIVAKIRDQYKIKIAQVKAEGKDKVKFAMQKIRGHFSGVAIESRKVVFMIFVVIIGVLSQGFGFFGIGSSQEIITTVVAILFLFVIKSIGLIGMREFNGLALFIGFNVAFKYILTADSFISQYIGAANASIVTGLFVIFSLLLMYRIASPEKMSNQRLIGIAALLLLLLAIPYMFGYVTSDRFSSDLQAQAVEREAQLDNLNFVERVLIWVEEMQARGRGDYIPTADQESVHQFIGVTVESVEPTREQFLEGKPVQLKIFYSTGSKEEKFVRTLCETKNKPGDIVPVKAIPLTNFNAPAVTCTFDELTKGTHIVKVSTFYDDSSQIKIPLMFISEEKFNSISKEDGDPSTFKGGVPKPTTSSGPINFKVTNIGGEKGFQTPLVLDPDQLNEFPHSITVQLVNPVGDSETQGKLVNLRKVAFTMPEGLRLGACDFQKNRDELLPYTQQGTNWQVDIIEHFDVYEPYESISCNMYVDESYVNSFIPPNTDYSISSMLYTIDYTYKLERDAPVVVT